MENPNPAPVMLYSKLYSGVIYLLIFQFVIFYIGASFAQDSTTEDLLKRLQELQVRMGALKLQPATSELDLATGVSHLERLYDTERYGTTQKFKFSGHLRMGVDYSSFTSQSVISRIEGSAQESLERLDVLLDRVEGIVSNAGSPTEAQEFLDDAVFFRNQAESELNSGDEETALQDMSISESLALEAARVAGEEITTAVEDNEYDGFTELKLKFDFQPNSSTRHRLTHYLREGDEYFQERFRWEFNQRLSDTTDFYLDSDSRVQDYQDPIFDDFLSESLLLRYHWRPDKHWTLRLENDFDGKTEYKSDVDEGFWSDSPALSVRYAWDRSHSVRLDYKFTVQKNLSDEEEQFDFTRHRLQQRYDYFGGRARLNFFAKQEWRDFNKPDNDDDYFHLEFSLDYAYDLTPWLSTGFVAEFQRRDFRLEGDNNTDYFDGKAGPVLQLDWARHFFQTFRYEWLGRWNREDDPSDSLDKKQGNFDDHSLIIENWMNLTEQFTLSLNSEIQWRRFRGEQSGEFETHLSDFRPISDFVRYSFSSNLSYNLTETIRLSGSIFYSKEIHSRFPSFDLEDFTANLEVRIGF